MYRVYARGDSATLELSAAAELPRQHVSGARFGAAVASLGDLDGDQFEDFAVGAPFEGDGAVYVYRGSRTFSFNGYTKIIYIKRLFTHSRSNRNRNVPDVPQKLTPANLAVPSPARGFGFSFSSGVDVDGNGRPDLAVGSLASSTVSLLRSRSVVRIEPESYKTIPFLAVEPELNGDEHPIIQTKQLLATS